MVAASWARRVEAAASPRSYRVQAHKQICGCPRVEEVHARKWKLDAPTQDTALDRSATVTGTCISRFPVNFRGEFRTPLHDQDIQERKSIINLLNPGNIPEYHVGIKEN
jgi:hypothetical protein